MLNQQHYHDNGSDQMGSNHDGDGDANRTNLIVNYLPQYTTEKDLYTLFIGQGPIEHVRIMKDFKTGYSFGFGFVKFVNPQDAIRAIAAINGIQYYNKRLKVSYARPPGEDIKDSNLYIQNLPKNVTEHDIDIMFADYGTIVQKNILKDKITGLPRGVAFVRFSKKSEAIQAMAALNGKMLDGCLEPLNIKIAEEHGKNKAMYYEGWKAGYQLNKGRPFDGGVRPQNQQQMAPRRGQNRGGYQNAGRGNHRFNPMGGGGDTSFSLMNPF